MKIPRPQYASLYEGMIDFEWMRSFVGALVLLGISFLFEHIASVYALAYLARPTSAPVGDLVLDNLPILNLNLITVEGALFSIVCGILFVSFRPRHVLFTLKALALFIAIRAVFISLTHVGIYPGQINPGPGFLDGLYSYLNFQTGFFFSGHTGMPILMALIFWKELPARVVFLSMSFLFGLAVLLTHTHYSIDVFAAPFMAYGIFMLARNFFPRDYARIEPVSAVTR